MIKGVNMMKILYIMLCVGDLECLIKFYIEVLGMKLFCMSENMEYKYMLVFVGYENDFESVEIELIYNWGVESYDLGMVYGYIVLGVDNIYEIIEFICVVGGKIICEFGFVLGGKIVIVFVEDLDGYKIEFIENK